MTAATHRFTGHCHGCRRDDRDVATRYELGARTLCDGCASHATNHAEGSPKSAVPSPGPGPGTNELPLVRQLLALYEAGEIGDDELGPRQLGRLRGSAPKAWHRIADDMDLRFRLLLTEGVTRALLYARSEPVKAGFVRCKSSAGYVLRQLVAERVVCCIGEAPKLGKGNGTKLFVPPGWRPVDPLAVERAGEHGLEDLVWMPGEPDLVGAAVQPRAELADDLVVVDGAHALEPSVVEVQFSRSGRRFEHPEERRDRVHTTHGRAER